MPEPNVIHNTFVVERSYPKSPEKVFAAFSDLAKKSRWYADRDSTNSQEFTMDFRVGGVERLQYKLKPGTPVAGMTLVNEGRFEDIVPNQRIVTSSTMDLEGKRISVSLVTIELVPTAKGTDLICTHQGTFFENSGGPEMRKEGWRKLLERLGDELGRFEE